MVLYFQDFLRDESDPHSIDTALRKGWKVRPDAPACEPNQMPEWNWQTESWDIVENSIDGDSFDAELARGFYVETEDFYLAMQDADRNQWTALRSQILDGLSMEKLSMDTPLIIWDRDGTPREVAVRRLREILFESGVWYIHLMAKHANL